MLNTPWEELGVDLELEMVVEEEEEKGGGPGAGRRGRIRRRLCVRCDYSRFLLLLLLLGVYTPRQQRNLPPLSVAGTCTPFVQD